jgi:hypothetical protein
MKSFHRMLLTLFVSSLLMGAALAQRRGGAQREEGFRFRFVGPVVGNRVASIAGIPGDPTIYYAGAASGGI